MELSPSVSNATNEPKTTEPHIHPAETFLTIYKDAVVVRRVSPLSLKAGRHGYTIKGVASTLIPSSLRLGLRPAAKGSRIEEYFLKSSSHHENRKDGAENDLEISINASQSDPHNLIDMLYFFKELGWKFEYKLYLAPACDSLELSGEIEISNQSGIDFDRATISLIDSSAPSLDLEDSGSSKGLTAANAPIYAVPHPMSLMKRSIKRVNLINNAAISVQQQYRLHVGGEHLDDLNGKAVKPPVEIWLNFLNDTQQGLGIPLPAGQAVIYYQRLKNTPEILGAVEIPYTSVNQSVSLRLPAAANNNIKTSTEVTGLSADSSIEAELDQTEFKKLTNNITEANYKLCLVNKTNQPATIQVVLNLSSGSCKIVKESRPHRVDSPKQFSWAIDIPPKSEVDLKYRLQIDQS